MDRTHETMMATGQDTVCRDLAVAHIVGARLGMTDLIYTHFSARDAADSDVFHISPYGRLFSEVAADSLSAVRMTPTGLEVVGSLNPAGAVIHEAIYAARPDVGAICHTHTTAGVGVSAMAEGLLMLSQFALRFHGRIGYHGYEGATLVPDERARLQRSLAGFDVLILRNHGLLTVGRTIREAFSRMYFLDRACRVQLATLAAGRPVTLPPPEVCALTQEQYAGLHEEDMEERLDLEWRALCRAADDPSIAWGLVHA
ncbi:class II aldolase/adducin family protein [Zavarzinia sp. CC-PAN008]|uniref:class II aldolase/adducin family protein n=1 Tax=Zavarzinia sp. CC-PAN008 TaxID=3243332 RepID=UPI003F745562